MEAQVIFLNTFTVCSPCKRKYVVRPLVHEETNGSHPMHPMLIGEARRTFDAHKEILPFLIRGTSPISGDHRSINDTEAAQGT
jgi:hypothetical protein